jgi:hypothetical protein
MHGLHPTAFENTNGQLYLCWFWLVLKSYFEFIHTHLIIYASGFIPCRFVLCTKLRYIYFWWLKYDPGSSNLT